GVPGEPAVLPLAPTARAVVLLVDGLGLELLDRHRDRAPFLSSLTSTRLTAGFPSTTATSLASLGTGLPPGEHGVTGYTSWAPEADAVVGWLTWTTGQQDLREQLVPEQVVPGLTVFERAERAGVAVTVAAPAAFEGSGLTRAVLRGGRYRGAVTPGDAVAHAVTGSRLGRRSLVYCYTPDLDLIGHVRGTAGEAWAEQLALVDAFAEQLAARLPPGTVLHVTGDHGMVDVAPGDRVDYDTSPVLQQGVRVLAGEPRMRHVHVAPGAVADVQATWEAELGDRAMVVRRQQAIDAGLLGPVVTPAAEARIGELLVIATGGLAIVRSQVERLASGLLGHHGALSEAELAVPLLTSAAPAAG
ncbi:MAG: alkaline phosphatase family protein, partial [Frankiales bacterium]|nr:alkaline phosphatase family protein [Frankiales bacterium]